MSGTVEIEVEIVDETDGAWAIANPDEDNDWANRIFLPKSQVTLGEPYRGAPVHQFMTVEMPEWLAMKEGLV